MSFVNFPQRVTAIRAFLTIGKIVVDHKGQDDANQEKGFKRVSGVQRIRLDEKPQKGQPTYGGEKKDPRGKAQDSHRLVVGHFFKRAHSRGLKCSSLDADSRG